MAVVETERHGQILVVRMNRPERLNALNTEMRTELARTWTEFRSDAGLEVAIKEMNMKGIDFKKVEQEIGNLKNIVNFPLSFI